nr:translation initiation factor IF-2-like [Oryctolagus cuniculus]
MCGRRVFQAKATTRAKVLDRRVLDIIKEEQRDCGACGVSKGCFSSGTTGRFWRAEVRHLFHDFPKSLAKGPLEGRHRRGRRGAAGRHPGGRPAGGGAGRRAGPGNGRARRASGGDGSAEGRCEAPARGSHGERPRRGARFSPRVCSSALARRPGAHPAAAPARPGPVTLARCQQGAPRRGAERRRVARGQPERIPTVPKRALRPPPPRPGTSDPEPLARQGGGRAGSRSPRRSRAPRRVCPVPPGRLLLRREPEPPGGRGRADDDEEEAAARTERRKPPGPRLLRGRARCASCGFPVSSPCWCTRPPGAHLPDCPRLRQRGP